MNKSLIIVAALCVALATVSYASANVEVQAVPQPTVACVPQVQYQAVPAPVPQVYLQAAPAPQYIMQQAAPTAYQVVTKEKRPGLRARIQAFRNAPRRQVQRLQAVQAAPVAPVAVQQACVGLSQ